MIEKHNFITEKGSQLMGPDGQPFILRGFGLGGWMNMENFITGHAGNEALQRQAIKTILGQKRYEYFFDRFLEYFFTEDDASYIQSLGLNHIRLAINYQHFEDDLTPFNLNEDGFHHLDRVIQLCARHGVYTIIDLHAVPGCQNPDWHSDNCTDQALFWKHKHFQDRVIWLWERIAEHYKDQVWVAAYDLVNEPADPTGEILIPFYKRLIESIRKIDSHHVLVMEGDRQGIDFSGFNGQFDNVVYSLHDYFPAGYIGSGQYPGTVYGKYMDRKDVEKQFVSRSEYVRHIGKPLWVGEFGPMYEGNPEIDCMRYRLLQDQLEIYESYQAGWSIWTYKDIGLQGLVSIDRNSAWRNRLNSYFETKERLGGDIWGGSEIPIRAIIEPIHNKIAKEFPSYDPYPFGHGWKTNRLIRGILFGSPLADEFARSFQDISEEDIDLIMESFLFKNCCRRIEMEEIITRITGCQPEKIIS